VLKILFVNRPEFCRPSFNRHRTGRKINAKEPRFLRKLVLGIPGPASGKYYVAINAYGV